MNALPMSHPVSLENLPACLAPARSVPIKSSNLPFLKLYMFLLNMSSEVPLAHGLELGVLITTVGGHCFHLKASLILFCLIIIIS